MARSEKNLTAVFTDTADAIRAKKGTSAEICPLDFADEITSIPTGPSLLTPNCEVATGDKEPMPITYDANGWSIKYMQGDSNYVYDFLQGKNGALTRKDGTLVVSSTGVIQPGYGEGTTLKLILPILSPVRIKGGSSIGAFIIGDAGDYDQRLLSCSVEFYTMDNVKIGNTMVLENCFGQAGC